MSKRTKHKCHVDHANQRWWVKRRGKQTCCCCGYEMPEKPKPMTRKAMQSIADNIADVYPGRKIIVLMPGDKVPDELKPRRKKK